MAKNAQRILYRLAPWALPLALVILWQIAVETGWLSNRILPAPSAVLAAFWSLSQSGELWQHLSISSQRALIGFAIGGSIGLILGFITGLSRWGERLLDSSVQMIRNVPHLALIPLVILNAVAGKSLPVYGNGAQVRDWLYVEDHARALYQVVTEGVVGETYNIGGHNERKNIEVVQTICDLLEELAPNKPQGVANYRDLITYVKDRPGHDMRYAIDAGKIDRELGWRPQETFESGIRKTVAWYLANETWWRRVQDGSYAGERLGLSD